MLYIGWFHVKEHVQSFQKYKVHFFQILLLVGPSPPSQLVPNPFNWSPNTVFTDISATVAQIQKFQKARCICFRILLLGEPSPPSQLVPNAFNWSPNTVFLQISQYWLLKKKKVHLLSNFSSALHFLPTPLHFWTFALWHFCTAGVKRGGLPYLGRSAPGSRVYFIKVYYPEVYFCEMYPTLLLGSPM